MIQILALTAIVFGVIIGIVMWPEIVKKIKRKKK